MWIDHRNIQRQFDPTGQVGSAKDIVVAMAYQGIANSFSRHKDHVVTTPVFNLEVKCADCPIRHRAVCARCDADELSELEDIKFYRTYEAGQTIVWAGDELTFVASVVRGVAKLGKTFEDGRIQMLGLLLPSDFIGRPGREESSYDVTAVKDVTLCCFRRKPFETMLARSPHLSERLLEMTLDELDAAREWMLILGRKTAREKIASLLAIIARREQVAPFSPTDPAVTIELPLTREAMSDYLGLTLETVSRQMSALRQEGIIKLEGKRRIIVPDLTRLTAQTGGDISADFSIQ